MSYVDWLSTTMLTLVTSSFDKLLMIYCCMVQDISVCWVSCKTGDGIESFLQTMQRHLVHL